MIDKINLEAVKTAVKQAPKTAAKGIKTVGATSLKYASAAKEYAKAHTPEAVKNIKTPEVVKKAAEFVKEHTPEAVKNFKTPEFLTKALNFIKKNKEVITGSAVVVAAAACAYAITKAVVDKVQESKPQDTFVKNAHQG